MRSWLRTALALVMPLAVLVGGVGLIARWEPDVEVRAGKVAGAVVNGIRRDRSAPEWIEARLAADPPRVLVLGNSVANTDVDVRVLAGGLRVRPDRVQVVSIPGSIGPHWYAVLRNRVYGEGHRPDVVVILTPLTALLETIPVTAAMAENLAVQLVGDEPEGFRRKIGSWRFGAVQLDRVRVNAGRLRAALFRSVRTEFPEIDLAIGTVLRASRLDYTLHGAAMPVVDPRDERVTITTALPPPDRSFLPELQELVCGHGGNLIVARPPLSPLLEPEHADAVPSATVAAVEAFLDPQCAALVDLSRLGVGPTDFRDPVHLDPAAARRMTALLAERLDALRAVQPAPALWRPAPAPRVERDGQDVIVKERWTGPPDGFQVQVVLAPIGGGSATGAALSLAGAAFPAGVAEPRGRLRATWTGPQPEAPYAIEVRSDVPVEIVALAIGKPGARTLVLGDDGFEGPRIVLVGPGAEEGLAHEGGTVQGVRARFARGGRLPPSFALPDLVSLFDVLVADGADPAACSPVEVRESGRALPIAESCRSMLTGRARSCFDGSRVWFRPLGALDPERHVLHARPGARCRDAVWLHPGARVRARVTVDGRLPEGLRRVEIDVLATDPQAAVAVAVGSAGRPVDAQVRRAGSRRWVHNLSRVVETGEVEVEIENRSDGGWVLVRQLTLR